MTESLESVLQDFILQPAPTGLELMNLIDGLQKCPEPTRQALLPLLQQALSKTLTLLESPDEMVRIHAFELLAELRLEPAVVVPRLIAELQAAHRRRWYHSYQIARALEAYGSPAAPAVPLLLDLLQGTDNHLDVLFGSHALAAIGIDATAAIPAMEAARDRLTLRTQSEDKQFKGQVNKAIRQLGKSLQPAKAVKTLSAGQAYLMDLIERMAADDDNAGSSTQSIASQARAEAEALKDSALIDEMAVLLRGKLKASLLSKAAVVLGFVTRNTDSKAGRRLILELLERTKLPALALQNTIYAATRAEFRDATPVMRRLLREGCTHALDFVEKLQLEECIEDVVAYMKHPKGSVLLGIFALQKIGSPQVVPYLMHYATREFTSRKNEEREWRFYAIIALGKLGDRSVVPPLIDLLARFEGWEAPLLVALCDLADPRAYPAVLATVKRLLAQAAPRNPREGWSEGYRTPLVNALDLFQKVGKQREPEVVELVQGLLQAASLNHLLPQEQELMRSYG